MQQSGETESVNDGSHVHKLVAPTGDRGLPFLVIVAEDAHLLAFEIGQGIDWDVVSRAQNRDWRNYALLSFHMDEMKSGKQVRPTFDQCMILHAERRCSSGREGG